MASFGRRQLAAFGADAAATMLAVSLGRGSLLLLQIVVARLLGIESLAVLVAASVIGLMLMILSDFGMSQAVVLISDGDPRRCRGLIRRILPVRSGTLILSLGVGFMALSFLLDLAPSSVLGGALVVASYLVQALARFLRSAELAAGASARHARMEALDRVTVALCGAVGALGGTMFLVGLGALIGSSVGLVRAIRTAMLPHARAELQRVLFRCAAALGAVQLAAQIYGRFDYMVLAAISDARVAGAYAGAYALVTAGAIAPFALSQAALAQVVSGRASVEQYRRLAAAVGVLGGVAITILGVPATQLIFGIEHRQLPLVFVLLGVAYIGMAYNSTLSVLAPMCDRAGALARLLWIAAIFNVGMCLLLIPAIGMAGAASATLLTECLVFVASRWLRLSGSPVPHGWGSAVVMVQGGPAA